MHPAPYGTLPPNVLFQGRARTRPLGKKSTILYSMTSCFCKMYNFEGDEKDLFHRYPNCMDGISVKNVMDEVSKLICE